MKIGAIIKNKRETTLFAIRFSDLSSHDKFCGHANYTLKEFIGSAPIKPISHTQTERERDCEREREDEFPWQIQKPITSLQIFAHVVCIV